MASSHKGAAGDSMGSSKMSIDQKRQLVYQLSKGSNRAFKEALQEWPCDEIREILCAESEKVRKYTGLTKDEIINKLFKTVSKKNTGDREVEEERNSSPKRQRKDVDPLHDVTLSAKTKGKGTIYCKNLACQAKLRRVDTFCKRCSCCICYKYDTNKDPSLWLTCNSDPPFEGECCGFACHLNCAFHSEKSGLKEDKPSSDIDGCFFCVSCGKTNSLLECLKKQLVMAEEDRRVDVLCLRLLVARKLLKGTKKYRKISEKVEEAVKRLETEFGVRLTGVPSEMSRGIVNRLCCAKDVKDLCSSALKLIDGLLLPSKMQRSLNIRFEDASASSVTLVIGAEESSSRGTNDHYSVWHRKVSEKDYAIDSTCELFSPNTRFVVSGLTPATEYCFKVVCFSGAKELSVDESKVSTQTLEEEEVVTAADILNSLSRFTNYNNLSPPPPSLQTEINSEGKRVNTITGSDVIQMKKNNSCEEKQLVPVQENLSIPPRFRSDELNDRQHRPESSNKMENVASCSFGIEHCTKLIRQLECSGNVKSEFRKKFLTWYSLRATGQEKYIVKIFVDTFKDDTAALAEQLIDTFSDCISRKRPAIGGGI